MLPDSYLKLKEEYKVCMAEVSHLEYDKVKNFIIDTFLYKWVDIYKEFSNRETDICFITNGLFEYAFDDADTLALKGKVQKGLFYESRLVVAFGKSSVTARKRDDSRLRGWVGRTEKVFGKTWDKGHFIAHSIGGAVQGAEYNVFQQRRDLNRGRSDEGKIFVSMEKYCLNNPGTFCFNRPIYTDHTAKPSFFEYGVLKQDNELWSEYFDNQELK